MSEETTIKFTLEEKGAGPTPAPSVDPGTGKSPGKPPTLPGQPSSIAPDEVGQWAFPKPETVQAILPDEFGEMISKLDSLLDTFQGFAPGTFGGGQSPPQGPQIPSTGTEDQSPLLVRLEGYVEVLTTLSDIASAVDRVRDTIRDTSTPEPTQKESVSPSLPEKEQGEKPFVAPQENQQTSKQAAIPPIIPFLTLPAPTYEAPQLRLPGPTSTGQETPSPSFSDVDQVLSGIEDVAQAVDRVDDTLNLKLDLIQLSIDDAADAGPKAFPKGESPFKKKEEKPDIGSSILGNLQGMGESITTGATQTATTTATGSPTAGSAAGSVASTVLSGISSLGPAGMVATAALAGVALEAAIVTESFLTLRNIMDDASESIKDLNPKVAFAEANREITLLTARLERSADVGDILADFVNAETQISYQLESLKTEIVKNLGAPVTVVLRDIAAWTKITSEAVSFWGEVIKKLDPQGNGMDIALGIILPGIWDILKSMHGLARDMAKAQELDESIAWANQAEQMKQFLDPFKVEKSAEVGKALGGIGIGRAF